MRRCLHAFLIAVLLLAPTMNAARACWHMRARRHCPPAFVVNDCQQPDGWCGDMVVISDVAVGGDCCEVVACPPACCEPSNSIVAGPTAPAEALAVAPVPSVVNDPPAPAPQAEPEAVAATKPLEPVAEPIPDLQPVVGDTVTRASNDEPATEPEPVVEPTPEPTAPMEPPVAEEPVAVAEQPAPEQPIEQPIEPVAEEPVAPVVDPVSDAPPVAEPPVAETVVDEPAPEPTEEPAPVSEPEPTPSETPEPEVAPESDVAPAPETTPATEPEVVAEPESETTPAPETTPTPEPTPEPQPQPQEPNLFDEVDGGGADAAEPTEEKVDAASGNLFDEESSAAVAPIAGEAAAPPATENESSDPFAEESAKPAATTDATTEESLFGDDPAPAAEPATTEEPVKADAAPVEETPAAAPSEPQADNPFESAADEAVNTPAGEPAEPAVADPVAAPASEPASATGEGNPFAPALPASAEDFVVEVEPKRRWIHATGATSLVATLVDVTDDETCVLMTDGQRLRVPLANLSAHDRTYVSGAAIRIAGRRDARERAIKAQAVRAPASTDTAGL